MLNPQFWSQREVKVVSYEESQVNSLKQLCDHARKDSRPAAKNYYFEALDYVINTEKRFDGGDFLVLYVDGEVVAASGYHEFPLDSDLMLFGVRTYTIPSFKAYGAHTNFLLPAQFNSCFKNNRKKGLMLFNDYNLKLRQHCLKLDKILPTNLPYEVISSEVCNSVVYQNAVQYAVSIELKRKESCT